MYRHRVIGKRRKGRILIAGVLTTALAFATSVTATYAWFSLDAQQKDQIVKFGMAELPDMTLEMGYYGKDGKTTYSTEENPLKFDEAGLKQYFAESGYDPSKPLDPVTGLSSENDSQTGKPLLTSAYRGGLDPKTFLYEDGSRPKEVGTYYQFEFAFRCAQDCWLYLSPQSHITPGDNANKFDKETGLPLDEAKLDEAVHALRVRFTGYDEQGNVSSDFVTLPTVLPKEGQNLTREEGKEIDDVYYGGVANLSASKGYYDVRDGQEVVYGQRGEQTIFQKDAEGKDLLGDGVAVEGGDFLHAGHALGAKVVDVAAMKAQGLIEKENAKSFSAYTLEDGVGQTSSSALLSLKAKRSQKLVVTVYLEGWDPYCTNDIGNAAMSLDLVFTGLVH